MFIASAPGVNFINVIHTHFCTDVVLEAFFQLRVCRKSCQNDVCTKKFVRMKLMKLTAGFNVLRAAFLHADLKSAKKNDNLAVFFVLSGLFEHKS